jgi:galactokinase
MAQPTLDRERIEMLAAALDRAYGPAADSAGNPAADSEDGPAGDPAYGPPPDSARVEIVRAPGRVNLIGDHLEFNEGFMLPVAIGMDTWIAFRRRQDGHVRVVARHSREAGSFWIDALEPAHGLGVVEHSRGTGPELDSVADIVAAAPGRAARQSGRWSDYVAGTAWSLREAAIPIRGFDGVVDTTIPRGSGLSASAALELAAALALIGAGRILAPPSLAALAQRAERDYVGVDCGIMDQFASAAGREGKAMLIDCRSLDIRHVALPFGLRVVVCDTGERPQLRPSAYLERRAECARAVALLAERMPGLCSLRDLDAGSLRRYRAILPEDLAARAEHVISENERVLATATALEASDLDELSRIFAESHASSRDLYAVSSPALDTMVEIARAIPGVVAARMTGLGFGSCTVNLVLADAVPALTAAVAREYDSRTGLRGRVYSVVVVDGAGSVATD